MTSLLRSLKITFGWRICSIFNGKSELQPVKLIRSYSAKVAAHITSRYGLDLSLLKRGLMYLAQKHFTAIIVLNRKVLKRESLLIPNLQLNNKVIGRNVKLIFRQLIATDQANDQFLIIKTICMPKSNKPNQ